MFALPRRDNKLNARTTTFGNDAEAWVETCQAGSRVPCADNGGLRYRSGRNCPASVCLGYKQPVYHRYAVWRSYQPHCVANYCALSGTTTSYTLTFVSPGSVASGGTITIGDSAGNTVVDTALNLGGTNNGVTVVSGSCLQSGGGTTSTKNPLVITLNSTSCAAGWRQGRLSQSGSAPPTRVRTSTSRFHQL